MLGKRLHGFFGDDWEDTLDSLLSAPGALGNIAVAAVRQVKAVDLAAFALVIAGWGWLLLGYVLAEERAPWGLVASLLPTLAWLACGVTGGLYFIVGGIGKRGLLYWESYLLIAFFACFGLISLRLALNPRDTRVYRATPARPGATPGAAPP